MIAHKTAKRRLNSQQTLPLAFQHDFHHSLLLPALQQNANSVEGVSAVLSAQRQRLLALYRTYCRNKPLSEALRAEHGVDQHKFFMVCLIWS
jgi:hypothetical protein